MSDSFVKSRRGILEHLHQNRLSLSEFGVFQLLLLLADKANGVVWTDSPLIAAQFNSCNQRTIKDALASLTRKGYIKSFRQRGSRGSCPILINKYEVTVGEHKGCLVNAAATSDWRKPVFELDVLTTSCERPDNVLTTCLTIPEQTVVQSTVSGTVRRDDVVTPSCERRDDRPPYSRPQETQEKAVDIGGENSPSEPPSETAERPPVDGEPEPVVTKMRLSELPAAEQPQHLTVHLWKCLGSPKHHAHELKDWEVELRPLCGQFDFPELYKATKWALCESPHWPQYIRRAANLVNNAAKIVDDYRASLRSKAVQARAKIRQPADTKKQAPSNYGTIGELDLKGMEKL